MQIREFKFTSILAFVIYITVILVIIKLLGFIGSWWWALSPLWITGAAVMLYSITGAIVIAVHDYRNQRH